MASGCVCASAISAEMNEWVKLGGANSGCCGNAAHTYGFHCAANRVSPTDYSRRHESGMPYRMNWASAGDFSHGNKPHLRAMHARVLSRLMNGELPMIAEFIGSPWAHKGVYYWARWNGVKTLQRYTGRGHDHWSHIAWFRSKGNVRAHLWAPPPAKPAPVAPLVAPGTVAPKYPGQPMSLSSKYDANVRVWQAQARANGRKINVDGIFTEQTQQTVRNVQRLHRLAVDGVIGPNTWRINWK